MQTPRARLLGSLLLGLAFVLSAAQAHASSFHAAGVRILAQPIDLADTVPGQDLWLFRYTVEGFDTNEAAGLSIFFDVTSTSALDTSGLAPAPPAWDVLVLQPDPKLPADGIFDALALAEPGASSGPFEVAFVWSGGKLPGEQFFTLYDENFAKVSRGVTTIVPEPATGLLVMMALAGLGARRRGVR